MVSEAYIMYATLQKLPCTEEEEESFVVEMAKANAKQRDAEAVLSSAIENMEQAQLELKLAIKRYPS